MKKKILAGTLVLAIALSGGAVFASNYNKKIDLDEIANVRSEKVIPLLVEGERLVELEGFNPYYKGDTLMVPLRIIAEEALDFEVVWNNEEKSVEIYKNAQWTKIKIDENSYFFAKVAPFKLLEAPEIKNGSTFVPIEFFNEVLKNEVSIKDGVLIIEDKSGETKEEILKGFIKEIDENNKRVLAAGDGTTENSYDIWLTVTDESVIVDKEGKDVSFNDLKVGTKIEATLPEMIAMSYPAQGAAVKIVVLEEDSFEIVKKEIRDDAKKMVIKYPEVKGMKGELTQEYINQGIENFVKSIKEKDLFNALKLDYEISLINDDKVSILFRGNYEIDGFEDEKYIMKSFTIDLNSTNEINFENYFKKDKLSQEKLNEILDRIAKENNSEEFEAEGVSLYFRGNNAVIYYWPLDDSVTMPVELYIPIKELKDIINNNFGEHPVS